MLVNNRTLPQSQPASRRASGQRASAFCHPLRVHNSTLTSTIVAVPGVRNQPSAVSAGSTTVTRTQEPSCSSSQSNNATTAVDQCPTQQIRERVNSSASCSSSKSAACVSPRRSVLLGAAVSALAQPGPHLPAAQAVTFAPPGFRTQDDKLDGYSFFYPEGWLPVSSSGNDCFFRNPRNIEENCFVDITSPSSSTFNSVTDLGTPEETANRALDRYLNKEFMSTRLGVRREGQVLFADSREGRDGRTYYDIGVRMSSYASSNPYVATQVRLYA
ncbi:PsbP-domain-containing protein [Dunaliella salina]|uniref:PsbP-domain-containing protein n=1 Tax=Dunaliella salina TaxID=3046 RepID=A0ABQ7G3C4_DUNSA|nr:PsbP-domain-containing protein [Dunaliella salina]|eukprot:KAF5829109.1 PsbP-domain-containing protein [Dunaliella salina]